LMLMVVNNLESSIVVQPRVKYSNQERYSYSWMEIFIFLKTNNNIFNIYN
jgi:hypothetical protein